jgi:hypothetical protein
MHNFKALGHLFLEFTPKCIIVGGEGGVSEIFWGCNLILLVTERRMQNFQALGQFFLEFTPKYIIVGDEYFGECNLILLVTEGCMRKFRTLGLPLLGEK